MTRKHSSAPGVTSDTGKVITPVIMDMDRVMPLALKYPNGLLMTAHPVHLERIMQAANESGIEIFVVTGTRLSVYYTVFGITSSVPTVDPTKFFETFRRLQTDSITPR